MTVTFRCPDAPTYTRHPIADDPEYCEAVSQLPEVNFSNENAAARMRPLGLPVDASLSGELTLPQIAPLTRALLLLINGARQKRLQAEVLAPVWEGRVLTPRRSEESILRRAQALLTLFQQAQQHGYRIVWG